MDIPYKGASNRIPDEGPFIVFLFVVFAFYL